MNKPVLIQIWYWIELAIYQEKLLALAEIISELQLFVFTFVQTVDHYIGISYLLWQFNFKKLVILSKYSKWNVRFIFQSLMAIGVGEKPENLSLMQDGLWEMLLLYDFIIFENRIYIVTLDYEICFHVILIKIDLGWLASQFCVFNFFD